MKRFIKSIYNSVNLKTKTLIGDLVLALEKCNGEGKEVNLNKVVHIP